MLADGPVQPPDADLSLKTVLNVVIFFIYGLEELRYRGGDVEVLCARAGRGRSVGGGWPARTSPGRRSGVGYGIFGLGSQGKA